MRIALFATCLADAMFPHVAVATVRLLERLGHHVVFPPRQTCCGQMHVNTGYLPEATPLVRHHVEVFEAASFDVAVAPSGSCVGSVRHQQAMVARRAGDPALARRVGLQRQWLHAVKLGFEHPDSGKYVEYEASYPDDLAHALDVIRDAD